MLQITIKKTIVYKCQEIVLLENRIK